MRITKKFIPIPKEIIAQAKEMDLLTYLKYYEPDELVHIKGEQYCTKSHDSLKISNGKWMWWSEGIGGRSALDYLIKVREMDFVDAVNVLTGDLNIIESIPVKKDIKPAEKTSLYIPPRAKDCRKAVDYLVNERGLEEKIVIELVEKGLIYQTDTEYANVAFVGKDPEGKVRCVASRGTVGYFKNTSSGSDRHYPFRLVSESNKSVLHVFESPIDLLSYASLMLQLGMDYREHNMIALCGIYQPKEGDIAESAIPIGIDTYIKERPQTAVVCLHLDNDKAGRAAAQALKIVLTNKRGLKVIDQPPPEGYKDCNHYLVEGAGLNRNMKGKEEITR